MELNFVYVFTALEIRFIGVIFCNEKMNFSFSLFFESGILYVWIKFDLNFLRIHLYINQKAISALLQYSLIQGVSEVLTCNYVRNELLR